ncbi:MAG: helix-turn-helix domain-containing protein [Archangiaceae bacterium]|nr:helix-turn-helix domain-containing protein [Archangiaceae bacterium]
MAATFADFGHFLRSQRELRGLSRDEVAQKTRIPPTLLAALEDGANDRFPELVFVVQHLKAYAQVVGLSVDDVLNRFHEIPGTLAPTEQSPVAMEAARRKRAWVVLVGVLVLVVLGLAGLWAWTEWEIARNLKP